MSAVNKNRMPDSVAGLWNRARKKKHANNKGSSAAPSAPSVKRDMATFAGTIKLQIANTRIYEAIPNHLKTKRASDGSYYHIGWTTEEDRKQEIKNAGL